MATLSVLAEGEVVKESGYSRLFQAFTKLINPIVTRPGTVTGRRICQRIWGREAPSRMAASSISYGTCLMKETNTQTVNGVNVLVSTRVMPGILSDRCSVLRIR